MGRVFTPAIVLHAFPYSETSKIVRLATRDLGVQSGLAKGARRPNSAFGARLELFSTGVADLYVREQRDLHTLAAYDVELQRSSLALDFARFSAAAVLAELMIRCAPPAPLVPAYDVLEEALDALVAAARGMVEATALRQIWRLVEALGFGPALRICARDGAPVRAGAVGFSAADGGVLCDRCAASRADTRLTGDDYASLLRLAEAPHELPVLDPSHAAAHRRLLGRFVRYHLAEGRAFEAVSMWEKRTWIDTSS